MMVVVCQSCLAPLNRAMDKRTRTQWERNQYEQNQTSVGGGPHRRVWSEEDERGLYNAAADALRGVAFFALK